MLGRLLTLLYSHLLKLYPVRFLDEFGAEMGDVFAQSLSGVNDSSTPNTTRRVNMVRLLFREVWYFPLAYLDARRFQASLSSGETSPSKASYPEEQGTETWVSRGASWGEALIGALPFLACGLAYLLEGVVELGGHHSLALKLLDESLNRPAITITAPMVVYFITALGLLFGVLKGFPRWSYAYLGMSLYFGWSYNNQNYYGVFYKWWVWLPPFVAIVLGLLITRSLKPLTRLLQGTWNDWTRLSFALYAFTAPLVMSSFFDMDWGAPQLYGQFFDTVLLAAGAVAFLRSCTIWSRVLSLEAVVLILVVKGMRYPSFFDDLFALHWQAFSFIIIYFGWLMIPAVIGLLRRGVVALSSRREFS
jgi:hypothetical protein